MGRKRLISLSSTEEMIAFGKELGGRLSPNSILALSGDLGAGKTTLVQGIAQGLEIDAPIQSPTFIYFNHYEGRMPLFHFDLYRMKGEIDFWSMGFDEYFEKGGVCAIEWPERIFPKLPKSAIRISIEYNGGGRRISWEGDL